MEKFDKDKKDLFDLNKTNLNDFGKTDLDEFDLSKETKNVEKEEPNKVVESLIPIAPKTEEESTEKQEDYKETFVWAQFDKIEKNVNVLHTLSIIGLFSFFLNFCFCVPGIVYNIVILILGIVNYNSIKTILKSTTFTEFETIRIQQGLKKARRVIIFSIISISIFFIFMLLLIVARLFTVGFMF